MKNGVLFLLAAAGFLMGCGGGGETASRPLQREDEPFPVLNAYGNWIDAAQYGRVWQPSIGGEWAPYTNGQWIWTDRGWMWESDEPYGWVVYHYGYWNRWGSLGWVWVPGYEWSPARVQWYAADDYIAWAPLHPPEAVFPRIYEPGYERVWVMVPLSQFTHPHVGQLRVSPPPAGTVRRGEIHAPPDIQVIQRATNQQIRRRGTEREDIREGQRTVTRVRLKSDEPIQPPPPVRRQEVAPPVSRPTPVPLPPANQRAPVSQPPAPRPTGQVRTPGAGKRGAEQGRPAVVPRAPVGKSPRETAKDTTQSLKKKPASPEKAIPRGGERR